MILIPPDLKARLLANGARPEGDHLPVVKLFNPVGAATWLITEMEADEETLFGLADLGFGCPEIGSMSLAEISSLRMPFGLAIERDLYFERRYPLSVYAEAARHLARITEDASLLALAAQKTLPTRSSRR